MTPLVWAGSFTLVALFGAACALSAAYDRDQRDRRPSESCCPVCDVGGPGACGGGA